MQFGRYELVERIGAGGMAEVFLAIQHGPRGVAKRLVIKRIAPARAGDPRFVELFEQEARVGCDLSHSNLVAVFEFGRVADHWFIAMEHVDGCDLSAALTAAGQRGERISPALIAYIAIEVCRGLAHVHARSYIHRDVTPRNVLVSWDGQVKLSDYGLAHASAHQPGAVRGTRSFMAPEQAASGPLDCRADLYSVGAMIAYAEPDHAGLAAIAATATAADPAARFASADALREALEPITAGVNDRALAAWLATLRPTDASPRASDDAASEGSPTWRPPPRTSEPMTETSVAGRSSDPLAPLDALLASSGRPSRRRRLVLAAAGAAVVLGAAVFVGYRATHSSPERLHMRCPRPGGYYCGQTLRSLPGAPAAAIDESSLYICEDDVAYVWQVCEHGCQVMPAKQADICRWREPRLAPATH